MESFRTELNLPKANWHIDHPTRLLCMGSCFAEQIGNKLQRLKFPVCVNPFGIVYNPYSMARSLENLIDEKQYGQEDLFEHEGLWHSFDHHGRFSAPEPRTVLDTINRSVREGAAFLRCANVLIITLGTAHVFRLKSTGRIVANCHKLAGQKFLRQRLNINDAEKALFSVFEKLRQLNPGLIILLTVSPVRHLRDGLEQNNLSKATLLLTVDRLRQTFQNVHYFPAYELLIDDLRDYRFYAADLSHPNDLALDYIWNKFSQSFFRPATARLCSEIEKLKRAVEHRPLHPQSRIHRRFLQQQAAQCRSLAELHPELDFSAELAFFESFLSKDL